MILPEVTDTFTGIWQTWQGISLLFWRGSLRLERFLKDLQNNSRHIHAQRLNGFFKLVI